MTSLLKRIERLEQLANANIPPEAAIIAFLPMDGDDARQTAQAAIAAHREAGRKVIVFDVVDASA